MSCCHVLVESLYRIRPWHLPVLLVHIMRAGAWVVANPDAKVLDLLWALLMYLMVGHINSWAIAIVRNIRQSQSTVGLSTYHVETDYLSIRLLDLTELHQEVPESRFGNDRIGGEYEHAIELWGRVRLCWQMTPNDLVLDETPWKIHLVSQSDQYP